MSSMITALPDHKSLPACRRSFNKLGKSWWRTGYEPKAQIKDKCLVYATLRAPVLV